MSKNDDDEGTQDLAEERTDWAEDRTVLANERTFSSRMGFALGCLGLAVGLQGVFKAVEPTWVAKSVASIFVVIATFMALIAYVNCKKMLERLNSHCVEPVSYRGLRTITALMIIGAIGVAVVLWNS